MKKNIGSPDRKLRAFVLAPALLIAGVLAGPTGWLPLAAYALAVVMLATSAVRTCPLYLPFGVSTCTVRGERQRAGLRNDRILVTRND